MSKTLMALAVVGLLSSSACSNWNRMTPASMDATTTEGEIRKNLLADKITGLTVTVNGGVVTLSGHAKNTGERSTAVADARKVPGVTDVVDNITIE